MPLRRGSIYKFKVVSTIRLDTTYSGRSLAHLVGVLVLIRSIFLPINLLRCKNYELYVEAMNADIYLLN